MRDRLPQREVVLDAVAWALSDVTHRDRDLLKLHAHELAQVHRFAVYPATFRPDLIVHRRKTATHNLLVVEWKKNACDRIISELQQRVGLLLDNGHKPEHPFNYQLGVLVNSHDDHICWRTVGPGVPTDDNWQRVKVQ